MIRMLYRIFLTAGLIAASAAQAQLTIDVTTQAGKLIPIAISPFQSEGLLPQSVTDVVGADLQRSGLFKLVPPGAPASFEPAQINFSEWNSKGAEALVVGRVTPQAGGAFEISFRLLDVTKSTQITSLQYTGVQPAQLRLTAHRIADAIFEALTGDKGIFSTRIAYIVKRGGRHEVQVADADGFNAQTIASSANPMLSLRWSPDGSRLAYVSFDEGRSAVVVQNLGTGVRTTVAKFPGTNSAPAWSPDGSRIVFSNYREGGANLYSVPATGGSTTRLTTGTQIDTEPWFSPDGANIVFVSDRGGTPQVYRMPAGGGGAQRLTFEGQHNYSPRYSPDGKSITFIQRDGGRYRVATLELGTQQITALTDSRTDESPSFAPNGKYILYANVNGGRGQLAVVSSDGRVKQRLQATAGDVQEPAWGPFVK